MIRVFVPLTLPESYSAAIFISAMLMGHCICRVRRQDGAGVLVTVSGQQAGVAFDQNVMRKVADGVAA